MNKNYDLTWDLKRLGTKVLFNKTYTLDDRKDQIIETVDIGVKPEDLDNIKIEAEIIKNIYTKKLGVGLFEYWYEPIVITGDAVGNEFGNEFSGDITPQVGKNIREAYMPYSNEGYFSNMSVTSARDLGSVTDAGVLMRNAGKMTITIPNPLLGERKTELHPYFSLQGVIKERYYPDPYELVTENINMQPRIFIDWTADGKIRISATDNIGVYPGTDPDNTICKIKITGHGIHNL